MKTAPGSKTYRLLNVISLSFVYVLILFVVKSIDSLWINESVKTLLDKSLGSVERTPLLQNVKKTENHSVQDGVDEQINPCRIHSVGILLQDPEGWLWIVEDSECRLHTRHSSPLQYKLLLSLP